jgi:Zn finger protein HypA/HybF involved in hydrogenase expression
VDAVEVVHGRWIVENEESIRCSECCFNRASIKMPLDYCPNCGAKMDGVY